MGQLSQARRGADPSHHVFQEDAVGTMQTVLRWHGKCERTTGGQWESLVHQFTKYDRPNQKSIGRVWWAKLVLVLSVLRGG